MRPGVRAISSSTSGAEPPRSGKAGFLPADDERSETIAALIAKAEELYEQRRYHEAIALCKGLLARGHMVAVMTMILEGCEGAVRRRRIVRATAALLLVLLSAGGYFLFKYLALVRIEPRAAVVQLLERQSQGFSIRTGLGRHRQLDYTWSLLDADGKPVPGPEQSCLRPGEREAWTCVYRPGDDVVKASMGDRPLKRFVTLSGVDSSGREILSAQWEADVHNVPRPPEIRTLSTEPSRSELISIASGQTREFHADAVDGDGGSDLAYEWLTAENGKPVATGPTWAYRPDYPALALARPGLKPGAPILHPVLCRVSNAHGDPLTETVKWSVRVVASNRPPQVLEIRPEVLSGTRVKEGVPLELTAYVHDPDSDDPLKLAWQLDGRVKSTTATCKLFFPPHTTEKLREMRLVFTVTDSCGAKADRSWRLVLEPSNR